MALNNGAKFSEIESAIFSVSTGVGVMKSDPNIPCVGFCPLEDACMATSTPVTRDCFTPPRRNHGFVSQQSTPKIGRRIRHLSCSELGSSVSRLLPLDAMDCSCYRTTIIQQGNASKSSGASSAPNSSKMFHCIETLSFDSGLGDSVDSHSSPSMLCSSFPHDDNKYCVCNQSNVSGNFHDNSLLFSEKKIISTSCSIKNSAKISCQKDEHRASIFNENNSSVRNCSGLSIDSSTQRNDHTQKDNLQCIPLSSTPQSMKRALSFEGSSPTKSKTHSLHSDQSPSTCSLGKHIPTLQGHCRHLKLSNDSETLITAEKTPRCIRWSSSELGASQCSVSTVAKNSSHTKRQHFHSKPEEECCQNQRMPLKCSQCSVADKDVTTTYSNTYRYKHVLAQLLHEVPWMLCLVMRYLSVQDLAILCESGKILNNLVKSDPILRCRLDTAKQSWLRKLEIFGKENLNLRYKPVRDESVPRAGLKILNACHSSDVLSKLAAGPEPQPRNREQGKNESVSSSIPRPQQNCRSNNFSRPVANHESEELKGDGRKGSSPRKLLSALQSAVVNLVSPSKNVHPPLIKPVKGKRLFGCASTLVKDLSPCDDSENGSRNAVNSPLGDNVCRVASAERVCAANRVSSTPVASSSDCEKQQMSCLSASERLVTADSHCSPVKYSPIKLNIFSKSTKRRLQRL